MVGSLVLFLLDGKELRVEQAAITAYDLRALTHSFRSSLAARLDRIELDEMELERPLAELGARLTGLLTPHLSELLAPSTDTPDRVPHLFLLPTADLHFWPLHALPLGDGARLIDHYAVSLLPAAAALPMLATQAVLPGAYNGFAPPTEYSSQHLKFALPQAYVEAAFLGGSVTRGWEANLDALRAVRGGVLSFATHALSDIDTPERSSVTLAAPEGTDNPIVEVTALEFLVGLDQLRCELLLLWACETHGSGAQSGDNWLGITRAFLRAGRTLVASLWPISDAATLVISMEFTQSLTGAEGFTVPQALRRAMRTVQRTDITQPEEWEAWTQVIEKALAELPDEERNEFISAWKEELETRKTLADEDGFTTTPFAGVDMWAPYVTIGWPARLSKVEKK